MWIKRSEVINYVNEYLKTIKVDELFNLSKTLKIEVDKKFIEDKLLERFSGEVSIRLLNYDKFVKAFKIYADKCFKISHLLKMLAGEIPYMQSLVEMLDITCEEDRVLLTDIDRLMKPLKVNYDLLIDVKAKAEDPETYMELIDFNMPKSSLLNQSFKRMADRVEMTDKKKREHAEIFKEKAKEAYIKRGLISE